MFFQHGLIKLSPDDVAAFLYKGEGLNKTAIGDYLGEKSDFNEKVLKAFVDLHDFTDLILVQALRQFLWSFRLAHQLLFACKVFKQLRVYWVLDKA